MQNFNCNGISECDFDPIDYLANSTLEDLTVSLKVLCPPINVETNDDKCKLINIEELKKWLGQISYKENKTKYVAKDLKSKSTFTASSKDYVCPTFDPISLINTMDELEQMDADSLIQSLDDISYDDLIELDEFLLDNDGPSLFHSLSLNSDSWKPVMKPVMSDLDDIALMDQLHLYNQTTTNVNDTMKHISTTEDCAESVRNKIDTAMCQTDVTLQYFNNNNTAFTKSDYDNSCMNNLISPEIDTNPIFMKNNNGESRNISRSLSTQLLGKRKSIGTKIQESQKRLELLRIQNTVLMNSKILSGNRIEKRKKGSRNMFQARHGIVQ